MSQEYRIQSLYSRAFNKPVSDYNLTNTNVTTQFVLKYSVVEVQRKES